LLPSPIGVDDCALAQRWKLQPALASKLVALSNQWEREISKGGLGAPALFVISGYRTVAQNDEVDGAEDSRHIRCPSEAVDLRVGSVQGLDNLEVWQILGGMWRLRGGRWGGTFSDPDPNHFDLG